MMAQRATVDKLAPLVKLDNLEPRALPVQMVSQEYLETMENPVNRDLQVHQVHQVLKGRRDVLDCLDKQVQVDFRD